MIIFLRYYHVNIISHIKLLACVIGPLHSKLRKQNLHLAYSMKIAQYKLNIKTRNAVIKLNDNIIESWKTALQTAQIEGYVSKRAEINSLSEYIQAQIILFIALARNNTPVEKQEMIMRLVIKTVISTE